MCTFAQIPLARFSVSSDSVNSITFNNESSGALTSYSWSFPGGNPSTSTNENPVVTYNSFGNYVALLTVTNSLGSSTASVSFTISGSGATVINLSTGAYDNGTLMSTDSFPDSDWTYKRTNGQEGTPVTRYKVSSWCDLSVHTDFPGINSLYITEGTMASGTYYYTGKSFTIPEGAANAELKYKAAAWRKHFTYLEKINDDNSITETLISQTTGQGHFCSGSTPVYVPLQPGTYRLKVKITSDDNSLQRNAVSINSAVSYNQSGGLQSGEAITDLSSSSERCINMPVDFHTTVIADTYDWKFIHTGGTQITASGANPSVSFDIPGSYKVELTASYANGQTSTLEIDNYITIISCDFTKAPNSYIFDPYQSEYDGLYIPVKKAYDMWADPNGYLNQAIQNGTLSAFVYWEDVSGIIKSSENYQLQIIGTGENAKIKVPVNKERGEGNAVISFHVGDNGDFSDPIFWSWHVWITDDPTNGTNYRQGFETRLLPNNSVEVIPNEDWGWMDRNLGAINEKLIGPQWTKSGGLLYQWGRKDPIPPLALITDDFYEISGAIGKVRHPEVIKKNEVSLLSDFTINSNDISVVNNIRNSVRNPLALIYNTNIYNGNNNLPRNWFGSQFGTLDFRKVAKLNLWSDNSQGNPNTAANFYSNLNSYKPKSSYDPCPNGWRMPSMMVSNRTHNGFANSSSTPEPDKSIRIDYSPFGVKTTDRVHQLEQSGHHIIKPTDNNTPAYMQGFREYSKIGFDLSNVNNNDMGLFPGTGFISKHFHGGKYSDQHESYIWTATMVTSRDSGDPDIEARSFRLITDSEQSDIPDPNFPYVKGRYQYFPLYINRTSDALACRCIKDPLFIINKYDFQTEYFSEENIDYKEGIDNPNSYIVIKNTSSQSLEIPVTKAFSVYNQLLSDNGMLDYNDLKVNVYWTTNVDLIQSVSINQNPTSVSDIINSKISIEVNPNQAGNALITLHNGNINNPVYWSWHIWVNETEPVALHPYLTEEPVSGVTNYINYVQDNSPLITEFMDRNLGALDSFPTVANSNNPTTEELNQIKKSGGLLYQFGRKDPLPSFINPDGSNYDMYLGSVNNEGHITYTPLNSTNYISNYIIPYNTYSSLVGVSTNDKEFQKTSKIVGYATQNPLVFMKPSNYSTDSRIGTDWVSDQPNTNIYRWGRADKKSPFDPCPEGWRIPDLISGNISSQFARNTSPWYKKGITQNITSPISDYLGQIVKSPSGNLLGYNFQNNEYKIGNYPFAGIRGFRSILFNLQPNDGISQNFSGIWTATLRAAEFSGNANALIFDNYYSGNSVLMSVMYAYVDPYFAMNCRCVKIKYDENGDQTGPIDQLPIENILPMQKDGSFTTKESVIEKLKNNDIVIYPNPVIDYIKIKAEKNLTYSFQIFDLNGNQIKKGEFIGNSANISDLSPGIYLITINNSSKAFKIIKK